MLLISVQNCFEKTSFFFFFSNFNWLSSFLLSFSQVRKTITQGRRMRIHTRNGTLSGCNKTPLEKVTSKNSDCSNRGSTSRQTSGQSGRSSPAAVHEQELKDDLQLTQNAETVSRSSHLSPWWLWRFSSKRKDQSCRNLKSIIVELHPKVYYYCGNFLRKLDLCFTAYFFFGGGLGCGRALVCSFEHIFSFIRNAFKTIAGVTGNLLLYGAQVTSGEIVRSDWLRRSDCASLLSRNRSVRLTDYQNLAICIALDLI